MIREVMALNTGHILQVLPLSPLPDPPHPQRSEATEGRDQAGPSLSGVWQEYAQHVLENQGVIIVC